MTGFNVTAHGNICEIVDLEFDTTGQKGGDAGHGGVAVLRLKNDGSGCNSVVVRNRHGREVLNIESVRGFTVEIMAEGDWELSGLEDGIIELARRIKRERKKLRWAREAKADEA